jgi:hypothetical protein
MNADPKHWKQHTEIKEKNVWDFKITEMPECRNAAKKVSLASLVLPLVHFFSPASAFQHRHQSGTAGHGLVR